MAVSRRILMSGAAAMLALLPLSTSTDNLVPGFGYARAHAKDSDGGDSDGGDSGGDDSDGGSNSGSGSGSGDDGKDGDDSGKDADDRGDDGDGRGRGRGGQRGDAARSGRNDDVARAERRGDDWDVVYRDGWSERIRAGRYQLMDPRNRTVVERAARRGDFARLRSALR